jgi:hypothetical protein
MSVGAVGGGRVIERRPSESTTSEEPPDGGSGTGRLQEREGSSATLQAREGAEAAQEPPEDDRNVVERTVDTAAAVAKDVVVRFQWGRVFK